MSRSCIEYRARLSREGLTMSLPIQTPPTCWLRRWGRALAALLLLTGSAGCSSLLDVELPTRVPAATLDNPSLSATLVNGAIADFECALVNYAAATGLLGA